MAEAPQALGEAERDHRVVGAVFFFAQILQTVLA
jgi:hypothetical protein